MGVKDVRPARKVADEFDAEAGRLWRPDKRGRPRARALQAEIADLSRRRRDALELDRTLRARSREKADAERALKALREEGERDRERLERLERSRHALLPVRGALARIRELALAAGAEEGRGEAAEDDEDFHERPAALRGLPDDPEGGLAALRDRRRDAEARIEALDGEAAEHAASLQDYRDRHQRVAELEDDVREAAAHMVAMVEMRRGAEEAEEDIGALEAACAEQGRAIFTVPWDEVPRDDYVSLDSRELRAQVTVVRRSRESLLAHRAGTGNGSARQHSLARPGWVSLASGTVLLAGGLALTAWWLFLPELAFETAGGTRITSAFGVSAAIFIGGGGLATLVGRFARKVRYRRYRLAVKEAEERRAERVAALSEKAEDAAAEVRRIVAGLPLLDSLVEAPGMELSAGIEKMADLARRLHERRDQLARRREQIERAEERIARVRSALSIRSGGDTPVTAKVLTSVLGTAVKSRERAGAAERDLERIADARGEAAAERTAVARELDDLEARLAGLAGGDPERGAAAAAQRLANWRRARELREELVRNHPRLDSLQDEIAAAEADGVDFETLGETLDELQAAGERRTARAEELQATIARLQTEIEHLAEGETADTIEGRIEVLRARVREAKEERDRAFLLARLVKEADRRFREENQPELLKRAGRYLGEVTRGRYERIELGDPGDEAFYLREPGRSGKRKVGEALSQGTKEQVYLALRLSIIGHLDTGRERLPLFMDETLVNWDAWRRDRAFGILERVAEERQVFIFTCHPAMAAEMEDRGARIIPLAE